MQARQLEVFCAVMRAGTVTGAAKALNISQPALSQILMHAEDQLGFPLFRRERGRLHPTEAALELYGEAEPVLAALDGVRHRAEDIRRGLTGLVRLASSPPPAMSLVPEALAVFRAERPDVRVRPHVAPVDPVAAMVRSGDAEIGIGLDDRPRAGLDVAVVGRVGFVCLLPQGHPLTARERVGLGDLSGETLASYREGTLPARELARAADAAGTTLAPHIEIDASLSAVGFVQLGIALAVVDALFPWRDVRGVHARPLAADVSLPIAIFTRTGRTLAPAQAALRDRLAEAASRYGAAPPPATGDGPGE